MAALRVFERCRRKEHQEETEKQQHVIVTENNLFKGFSTKDVRNYYRKQSGQLDNDGRWRCGSTGEDLAQREEFRAAPLTATNFDPCFVAFYDASQSKTRNIFFFNLFLVSALYSGVNYDWRIPVQKCSLRI